MFTSSVINQFSLRLSPDEQCHQLYRTWKGKEKEKTLGWCYYRMNRETEIVHRTLCSYSCHVCSRWLLKKKGEKKKAGKVVGLHTGIFSRDSLAQFSRHQASWRRSRKTWNNYLMSVKCSRRNRSLSCSSG